MSRFFTQWGTSWWVILVGSPVLGFLAWWFCMRVLFPFMLAFTWFAIFVGGPLVLIICLPTLMSMVTTLGWVLIAILTPTLWRVYRQV